jgi:hypothetical protein
MSTRLKLRKFGTAVLLSSALLCAGIPSAAAGASGPGQRKTAKKKKQPELPPLPSGPTGRQLTPMPLDAIAAVPPQVTYENNQLTINAPNSTLGDILRAVRKLTGAEIEIPAAPERVVTHLGPGPARDVVAELLNGSRFNYVLLGSPTDNSALTRVVLVAKAGVQEIGPSPAAVPNPAYGQQPAPGEADAAPEGNEADANDDSANNADENADQPPADADQQQAPQEQAPGVKTPQQMLQEMQQRQMQMQQQQQQGQPPAPAPGPGSGMQPHPPQEN